MISLPLEISNELDEMKGRSYELVNGKSYENMKGNDFLN